MKLYDCHVRLADSTTNEVPLFDVTVPEIYILRDIHGIDAVVRIKPAGEQSRNEGFERDRLAVRYTGARVAKLFGQFHQALPDQLDPATEARIEEVVVEKERQTEIQAVQDRAAFEHAVKMEVGRRLKEQENALAEAATNSDSDEVTAPASDGEYDDEDDDDDTGFGVSPLPAPPPPPVTDLGQLQATEEKPRKKHGWSLSEDAPAAPAS